MDSFVRFVAILAESFIFGLATISASAQNAEPQLIAADGSTAMLGRPAKASPQMALTEKPLTLIWASQLDGEAISKVRVDRVTDTRRVEVMTEEIRKAGNRWSLSWTPPKTRAVVRYEVRIKALPDEPIILEVHDVEWIEKLRRSMSTMNWVASGLSDDEVKALKQIGASRIKNVPQKASQPTRLQMIEPDSTGPRRKLIWDTDNHHMVVWASGPTTGDIMIRAPRWWISSEALSTDHGLIRLYKLLFDSSGTP